MTKTKKILFIEPFYTGSHRQWLDGLKERSKFSIELLTLPGRFWKWRMEGGAVQLASMVKEDDYSMLFVSDMLNLPLFLSLTGKRFSEIPKVIYFHENQLSYPWSQNDSDPAKGRDIHYGFINYTSSLAADHLLFNSRYHLDSFNSALKSLLQKFPDFRGTENLEGIRSKSHVLYLGLDLMKLDISKQKSPATGPPVLLWNHRREHDKQPEVFLELLEALQNKGADFRLILLGESFKNEHPAFKSIKEKFSQKIIHDGYVENFAHYKDLLHSADFLPVTSIQDFFGISIMEAAYCGVLPLLPRRLTYPELYGFCENIFYDSIDELASKIITMDQSEKKATAEKVRKVAASFDWSVKTEEYDRVVEGIIGG